MGTSRVGRRVGAEAVVAATLVLVLLGCTQSAATPAVSATPPATERAEPPTPSPTATAAPTVPPIPASAFREVDIGGGPNTIAMSSDRVWVELHRENIVASVDPTDLTVTRHPTTQVHCTIASDGANAVWAAYHSGDALTRIDAATGMPALTVTIPDACGLGVSGDQVWATSPATSRVYRVDPVSGDILVEVSVPAAPFGAAPLGDRVYASGEGGGGWLAILDPASGETLAMAHRPQIVLPDGLQLGFGSLWAAGRPDRRLLRLDPTALAVQAQIEIGGEPSGLAVTSDAVWVTRLDGRLYRIDPASNAISATWELPYSFLAWPTLGFDELWMTS